MAKKNRDRDSGHRNNNRRYEQRGLPGDDLLAVQPRTQASRKPLQPKTDAQAAYINAIEVYDLVFCKGPAGTGKTYIPAAMAAEAFRSKQIKKIIITRPAVGADEEHGFLPGDLKEKMVPWAKPVLAILEERLGASAVEYMIEAGTIEIAPLGMLRGHTFNNAFVILDEAQNVTPKQMKLFLTRIGENAQVIVDGDPYDQTDINGMSGMDDAWDVMSGHPQVGFIEFTIDDIVRSGIVRDVLIRYATKKGSAVGHAANPTTGLDTFLSNAGAVPADRPN
jgi:phosphate starvation-inducible PhoH-like protein